jgi:hypothetical protein
MQTEETKHTSVSLLLSASWSSVGSSGGGGGGLEGGEEEHVSHPSRGQGQEERQSRPP